MKALRLYGKEDLRYEEVPFPEIEKEDEVVVKVKAAGVCGSDISRYKKLGPYIEGMPFGHEFSGEIAEVGPGVTGLKTGDRVTACPAFPCRTCPQCDTGEFARCERLQMIGAQRSGSYAEFVKVPAAHIMKLPDQVAYDTAALTEPSAVVAHGFYKTRISPGSVVAVVGRGSIGLLVVQWAKIFGAKKVIAIDLDENKLRIAGEVGADVCLTSMDDSAQEQILERTDGHGVDVAIEAAGSPVTSAEVLALPRKGGEVVFLGIPYADIHMERHYFEKIVRNELRVLGSWNAISSPFPGKEWKASLHYMSTGAINVKSMISHRLTLREGPSVFRELVRDRDQFAKVVFRF